MLLLLLLLPATHWYTAATLSLGGFQVWRLPPYHGFLKEFKNHLNSHAQYFDSLLSFVGLSSSIFLVHSLPIFGPHSVPALPLLGPLCNMEKYPLFAYECPPPLY